VFGKTFLMQKTKVKTDWASLSLADDGSVMVCFKSQDGYCCIRFNSLLQLKEAIDGRKIAINRWIVAVPWNLCILKSLILPASDLSEAASMIEFELPTLVPLSPEKIVYGCTLLSRRDNTLNVLVSILKLSILNRVIEPYRAIGIKPHKIILNTLAIQSWFNANNGTISDSSINVLVDGNRSTVSTGIDGNFKGASDFGIDGEDRAVFFRRIFDEILCQKEELLCCGEKEISVFLAGADGDTGQLKILLDEKSGRPAFSKVIAAAGPKIACYDNGGLENGLADFGFGAVIAAGLLISAADEKLKYSNLLPQRYLRKFEKKTLLFNYAVTGVLSVLLIVLLWMCPAAVNIRVERISHKIESQIAPIEHIAGGVDSKRQRVKAIQKQMLNRGRITEILKELYLYTPKAISISELKFTSDYDKANIEIKGQADMLSSAFEYTDAMNKAKLLDKIQIINAQQIPVPGGSVVEFKANCVIRGI